MMRRIARQFAISVLPAERFECFVCDWEAQYVNVNLVYLCSRTIFGRFQTLVVIDVHFGLFVAVTVTG